MVCNVDHGGRERANKREDGDKETKRARHVFERSSGGGRGERGGGGGSDDDDTIGKRDTL